MDKYEQLEKLQDLKEKGTLSETEFLTEKNKLLNSNVIGKNSTAQTVSQSNQLRSNGAATAGLVLSLVGILIIPFLFGLMGLIFSGVGLSKPKQTYKGRGAAVAGLIIGIIDLIWGFFWFALINS